MAEPGGRDRYKQEKLWRELLADSSKWLDNRPGKCSPKSPDFKHKQTGDALWLDSRLTPAWVPAEIFALFGRKSDKVEKLWREFFADPSKWGDNRSGKTNPKFPDFKHKKTGEGLWLDNKCTPKWVKSEIAFVQTPDHEKKWQDLFSNPSDWWDHRSRKGNPRFPDFIHKLSAEGLWLVGKQTPSWVVSKVASMGPGTLQTDIITMVERLSRYNKAGHFVNTLELFEQMQHEGIASDFYIFLHVLHACAASGALEEGRCIHGLIVETGWEFHPYIMNSLIDMYAKCGSLEDARNVLNKMPKSDVVGWNSLLHGFVRYGQWEEALELFQDMQELGIVPDSTTFVALLNACAKMAALEEGQRVHNHIMRSGCESNVYVGNALVDMYAKCGSMEDAKDVFYKMRKRDLVCWNALILGYIKCGQGVKALELFQDMQHVGILPDSTTFVALLNACASIAALDEGRRIHNQVVRSGCESNVYIGNALVDMYAKCGSIEEARAVFYKMPRRNVVSWNAMILGFAMHGLGKEAVALFEQMSGSGCKINEITFICLLSACSHGGLVTEGLELFRQMQPVYGVSPSLEHYTCMVQILGRAGLLDDAEAIVKGIPLEHSAGVWMSLLSACRIHGNLEMGERAAQQLLHLDPEKAAG